MPGVRRTPPGVRELKLAISADLSVLSRRTPPGVRELKRTSVEGKQLAASYVAPLPGCVN